MKIGITIGLGKTQFQINQAYVNYIAEGGYEPILITPMNDVNAMADICDGLLLPGGIDIDPIYYGRDNHTCLSTNLAKDEFERSVFMSFLEQKKPVFGICRGFQLMALEAQKLGMEGMYYSQDISKHAQGSLDVARNQCSHFVTADTDKLYVAAADNVEPMPVNSLHHQCLMTVLDDDLAQNNAVTVLAYTARGMRQDPEDQGQAVVVEAADFHVWNDVKVRGVQWHPEELMDVALLHQFFGFAENGAVIQAE